MKLRFELEDEIKSLSQQLEDWTRRSESCESKLGQLEANEEVMRLQQQLATTKQREKMLRGELEHLLEYLEAYAPTAYERALAVLNETEELPG